MASVSPHKFQLCATCKRDQRSKPAKSCRKCKVLAWRTFWRQPDGSKRSEVFDQQNGGKKAADAKKAQVEAGKANGSYVDPHGAKTLFVDFAEEWAAAQDWKDSTRDRWPGRVKRLRYAVGESATLGVLSDRLALMAARTKLAGKYARNTVAGDMHLLMAIVSTAAASGRIPRDPTVGIDAAPKRRADDTSGLVTPDMVPTPTEALRILSAADSQWRAAHALGLAGCRIGEVLGMQRDRIDLDNRRITIDTQATELTGRGVILTTPKAEKCRTITVPEAIAVELRRHLRNGYGGRWADAQDVKHNMLFLRNGRLLRHSQFYALAWYPTLRAAGLCERCRAEELTEPSEQPGCTCRPLRFKFHAYRHLAASQLLSEGAPLPAVAGYLGDHIQTVTKVYAHWLRDDEDIPAEILARVLVSDEGNASQMPHALAATSG